jgi:hypothetical protein
VSENCIVNYSLYVVFSSCANTGSVCPPCSLNSTSK